MKFTAAYLAATAAVTLTAHPPKSSLAAIKVKAMDWYSDNGLDECDLKMGATMGIYDLIDTDNSGDVTFKEFEGGIKFIADGPKLEEMMTKMFKAADTDSNGSLDVEELKAGISSLGWSKED